MRNSRLINSFYRDYKKLHKGIESCIEDEQKDTYISSRILNRVIIVIFIRDNLMTSNGVNLDILYKAKEKGNLFNNLLNFYENPGQFINKVSNEIKLITSFFEVNYIEKSIFISNEVIINIFTILGKYQWSLTNKGVNYITPDILGSVFEKYINQKENGAYYTDEDTIGYINTNSIMLALFNKLIFKDRILNKITNIFKKRSYNSDKHQNKEVKEFHDLIKLNYNALDLIIELISNSDDEELILDIHRSLKEITIIDITVGTGAFILEALDILTVLNKEIYKALRKFNKVGYVDNLEIALSIIENNLYGLDIMNDAIEIAKFRMYLQIFSQCINSKQELSRKININFKVGNAITKDTFDVNFEKCIKEGGFDCIIGNPPYIEYLNIKDQYDVIEMETMKCGNIYAYIVEKSLNILKNNGVIGVIVPISIVSTPRMSPLRKFIEKNCKVMFFSNFGDRPGTLFNGVHQKVTIFIGEKGNVSNQKIYTSQYYHWYNEERGILFDNIEYIENKFKDSRFYYKIQNNLQESIITKINSVNSSILDITVSNGKYVAYLSSRLTFWVKCFIEEKKSKEFKKYYFDSQENLLVFMCLMNSNLYYFLWETISDGWHITNKELEMFKFDSELLDDRNRNKLIELALDLEKDLEDQKKYVGTKQTQYEYRHKKSKKIIDKIDLVLSNHYKLTHEEYNFIIDYNLKYRMNDELENYLNKRRK